jgi:hypothetical protein
MPSKDPIQQKLRDHKRKWSNNASVLISKIIAFKRALNGRGDAKFNLKPSSIQNPLPNEIPSFLSQLTSDFEKIISDAGTIITEQNNYSKTRKKKLPAKPIQKANPLEGIASINHSLEKYGSSRLSRFWQYVSGIFSRKEYNPQRLGLLSQAADLRLNLLDFENAILSIKVSSIPNAIEKYKDLDTDLQAFLNTYDNTVKTIAAKVMKPEEKPQEEKAQEKSQKQQAPEEPSKEEIKPQPKQDIINKIKDDLHLIYNENLNQNEVMEVAKMVNEYEEEEDPHLKSMWEERIKENYKHLIKSIANEVQKTYGPTQIKNLQDILNHVKKNKTALEIFHSPILNTAHNAVSRYLKRDLVKTLRFNKTSPLRIEIANVIDEMKKYLNSIMNSLEKNLSIEELNELVGKLKDEFAKIHSPLHVLYSFYLKEYISTKHEKQPFEKYLFEPALRRNIRRTVLKDL